METKAKVKLMGELSHESQITTGVRQDDELSPLHFNCALENVVREWRKAGTPSHRLGPKIKGIEIDCLAFSDDMALIVKDFADARRQIAMLEDQSAKIGLQISYEEN